MGLRVDFSNVEQSSFEPLPAGTYLAKVTNGEKREAGENSKNPGSIYINWELTVQEGPYNGRKVWMNTSLVEKALPMLKSFLDATERYDTSGEIDFDIEDVIGVDVKIRTRLRDYKGEPQAEVKRVMPVSAQDNEESSVLP